MMLKLQRVLRNLTGCQQISKSLDEVAVNVYLVVIQLAGTLNQMLGGTESTSKH